jgi:hydrogenase maturation protease
MRQVRIAGVGNILLGDDGVGPSVVRLLESAYAFEPGVEVQDLGTPALDFIDYLAGVDVLIVVDSVDNGKEPGMLTLYRKEDLAQRSGAIRMDTHSPAITESMIAAEVFFGASPKEFLLIGVSASHYDAGCQLSERVAKAVPLALQSVLAELDRLGIAYKKKPEIDCHVWWSAAPAV